MKGARNREPTDVRCPQQVNPWTESRLPGTLKWGSIGRLGVTAKRCRVSFQGDENVPELIVVMVV